jgi:ABC-type transporter Mla subunit MlaD
MTRLGSGVAGAALAVATVIAGVLLWHAALGISGGRSWTAEFTDARGLVAGNDVRVGGAVVGRVSGISLSRSGTALVRFTLADRRAYPRTDAAAAIRPADLLGDNYLSLSRGTSSSLLRGPIRTADTVNAPRLDQVLDAFGPRVRTGLQTLLVEGGIALDQRGGGIARAIVDLRPALDAAYGVLGELDAQNVALARLLPAAEGATGQLDARRADLGPLLGGLARTLSATAGSAGALDQAIVGLPGTLSQARSTATRLSSLAATATPLAGTIGTVAAPLGEAVQGLPSLLDRIRTAAPSLTVAVQGARQALVQGGPGLAELARALPVLGNQAPEISSLLGELDQAAPGIAQGFLVDFPDQAAEPGNQPLDPFADPTRNYWRGAAVLSCQTFGVADAPGCLTKAIANLSAATPTSLHRAAPASGGARSPQTTPTPGATGSAGAPAPSTTAPAATPPTSTATGPSASPTATTPTTTTATTTPSPSNIAQLLSYLFRP